jgi:3-phosphoshikimate 1-carboxyvinyltransferase
MAPTLDQDSSRRPLVALRARGLRGRLRVAPDPTLFALAACLASLSRGRSVLYVEAGASDPNRAATERLLHAAGVPVSVAQDRWEIEGLGPRGWLEPERVIDFSGAGRVAPLALGLFGSLGIPARLVGDLERGCSLAGAMEALRRVGAVFDAQRTGQLPVTVRGPLVTPPFALRLDAPEPTIKAAVMLAAVAAPGASVFEELPATPDHPERLLRHFGASVGEARGTDGRHRVTIGGLPDLRARALTPIGDLQAALLVVLAALLVPDSEVRIDNVPMHPLRGEVLAALEEMGGDIAVVERRSTAGDEVVDLRARHSRLFGARLTDRGFSPPELAILGVAAAFAAGETRLGGADTHPAALRRLAEALAGNGASVRDERGVLGVGRPGPGGRLGGGVVEPGDPSLSAAMLVFGLAASSETVIADAGAVEASFPGLIAGLEGLGAEFDWREAA